MLKVRTLADILLWWQWLSNKTWFCGDIAVEIQRFWTRQKSKWGKAHQSVCSIMYLGLGFFSRSKSDDHGPTSNTNERFQRMSIAYMGVFGLNRWYRWMCYLCAFTSCLSFALTSRGIKYDRFPRIFPIVAWQQFYLWLDTFVSDGRHVVAMLGDEDTISTWTWYDRWSQNIIS